MKRKKNVIGTLVFLSLLLLSACSNNGNGPAEDVLSKKVYSRVVSTYDGVGDFYNGVSVVRITDEKYDSKYGAINTKGEVVIPIEYDEVNNCHEGRCIVRVGGSFSGKYGVVDATGKVIVAPTSNYSKIEDFENGLAVVKDAKSDLYGYINLHGEVSIPLTYKYAYSFSEDLACVKVKANKYGYINEKGDVVIPMGFDDAESFSEGLAVVEKANKEMVIDKNGEIIYTLPKNQEFYSTGYHNGLICVVKDRDGDWWSDEDQRCGYLDTKGEVVIDFIYDDADDFEDGIAYVEKNNRDFCINTKGEEVECE